MQFDFYIIIYICIYKVTIRPALTYVYLGPPHFEQIYIPVNKRGAYKFSNLNLQRDTSPRGG